MSLNGFQGSTVDRRSFLGITGLVVLAACGTSTADPAQEYSLLPLDRTPTIPAVPDRRAVKLGVWFRASLDGFVSGIRFFRDAGDPGPYTVFLHSRVGTARPATFAQLGTTTMTGPSGRGAGWLEARFDRPVAVTAQSLLCASYVAPRGGYAVALGNDNRFRRGQRDFDSGPLTAVFDFDPDGVAAVQMSMQMPVVDGPPRTQNPLYQGFQGSDYLIDVLYSADRPAPAAARTVSPTDDATGVSVSEVVRVRVDQRVRSPELHVTGPDGEVNGATSWSDLPGLTVSWRPRSPLSANTKYTVELRCDNTVEQSTHVRTHSFSTGPAAAKPSHRYWERWSSGFPAREDFFPVGVFYQTPRITAVRYAALGINFFNGGRPGDQFDSTGLAAVASAGMFAVPFGYSGKFAYDVDKLVHDPNSGVVRGFNAGDEPDLQAAPPQPPDLWQRYVGGYRKRDPSRPVHTNMGRLGSDLWAGYRNVVFEDRKADLEAYVASSDWLSADYYGTSTASKLGIATYGAAVTTMRAACRDEKPVFGYVETCDAAGKGVRPTPDQVESAVWSCIVSGARGITYFVGDRPGLPGYREAGLLGSDYAAVQERVRSVNARLAQLAPVLNQEISDLDVRASVQNPSTNAVAVQVTHRVYRGELYVFCMQTTAGVGDLVIDIPQGFPAHTLTPLVDSGRELRLQGQRVSGRFTADYQLKAFQVT